MVKLVTFLERNDKLSRAGFIERWLNIHAPIAAQFAGLRRYVLSGSVEETAGEFDAFAELWFDDRGATQRAYSSEVGRRGSADANAYTSRRRQALLDETWVVKGGARIGEAYKAVLAMKRPDRISRAEFLDWCEEAVAHDARSAAGERACRLCYDSKGLLLDSDPNGPGELVSGEGYADGLVEIWFDDERSLKNSYQDVLNPLVRRLELEGCRTEMLLLREHRIV